MVIHLMAPNDSNGNPRRLYVVVDAASEYVPAVAVVDEGHSGIGALDQLDLKKLGKNLKKKIFHVDVPISEYNKTKRDAKKHGICFVS